MTRPENASIAIYVSDRLKLPLKGVLLLGY